MANEQMRDCWTSGATGWVVNERIFDAALAPFTEAIMGALAPGPADRVLDVGCGSGTLLGLAAERGSAVVGVDISPVMVEAAARRVPRATVAVADAQTVDLATLSPGGPFTGVMSRFGVMFFDDPVAAFVNIRRSTASGARLAFVCWRGIDENPMFTFGHGVIEARLDERPPSPPAGAPGPTAFADADRVRLILGDSGWTDIGVEPVDGECNYGIDGSDGVEERLTTLLASSAVVRARAELEPRLGPGGWAAVVDDVRAELRSHLVDGVLKFNGATWLVTARTAT